MVWVASVIVGASATVSLALLALNKNINLYFTPSQLNFAQLPKTTLRVGGLVKQGSVKREAKTLAVNFTITDFKREILVTYTGILPALFREGQGVVVEGHFSQHLLEAEQVLAKHDENYRPPGIPQSFQKRNK